MLVPWEAAPSAVAVGADNSIIVAVGDAVKVYDVDGEPMTSFTIDLAAFPDAHSLLRPTATNAVGMVWDGGRLFVADAGNRSVVVMSFGEDYADPVVTTVLRHRSVGDVGDIAVSAGTVFLSDPDNDCVHAFNPVTGALTGTFGESGGHGGAFSSPRGLAVTTDGNLVVVDSENHRVQVLAVDGAPLWQTGERGYDDGEFNRPTGACVTAGNHVVVADTANDRVQGLEAATGKYLWTVEGVGEDMFDKPMVVGVASDGDILVAGGNGAAWIGDPTAPPEEEEEGEEAEEEEVAAEEAAPASVATGSVGGAGEAAGGGEVEDGEGEAEAGNDGQEMAQDEGEGAASDDAWTVSSTESEAEMVPPPKPRRKGLGGIQPRLNKALPPYMQIDKEALVEDMAHLRHQLKRLRKERQAELEATKKSQATRRALQAELAPHSATLALHGVFLPNTPPNDKPATAPPASDWSKCRSGVRLQAHIVDLRHQIAALQRSKASWNENIPNWEAQEAEAKKTIAAAKSTMKGVQGSTRHSVSAARKQLLAWEADKAKAQLGYDEAVAAADADKRRLQVAVKTLESELEGLNDDLERNRAEVASTNRSLHMEKASKTALEREKAELLDKLARMEA